MVVFTIRALYVSILFGHSINFYGYFLTIVSIAVLILQIAKQSIFFNPSQQATSLVINFENRYVTKQENQPNCPKAFLSVGSLKDKKGNNSISYEPIFLKFCGIICECKYQLYMWPVNFSRAKKTIKLSREDGGNFINKNWCVQKIS